MRKLILNFHLLGALIGGIFLIILGGTGGILAFQDELDRALNPGLFKISPDGLILPLDAIQQSVTKFNPKLRPYRIVFPEGSDRPYVAFAGATQVFINSHTGAIIGTRQSPTLLGSIRQLHTKLLLGESGSLIVQAATWLSLFLIISGLYLWWPLRRTGRTRGLSFYLHLTFGIYFAIFLLALTLTGLVIAYYEPISSVVFSVTHSTPPKWNVPSTVIQGAKPIAAVDAVRIASENLPKAKPFAVNLPDNSKSSFHIDMKYPDDTDSEGSSWVVIDQYNGAILFTQDAHALSSGVKMLSISGSLHTGAIWGLPSKIIMALTSFVLVLQTVTGYLIWARKLRGVTSRSS